MKSSDPLKHAMVPHHQIQSPDTLTKVEPC